MLAAVPLHAQTSAPASTETPTQNPPETPGRKCHDITENQSKPGVAAWYRSKTVIDWNGACLDGMADGFGRFTMLSEMTTQYSTNHMTNVDEGMMARGQMTGMWCNISSVSDDESTIAGKYMKIHSDKPRPCTLAYSAGYAHQFGWRHNPDGSWSAIQIGQAGLNAPLNVSAGTMDMVVTKLAKDRNTFPDFPFATSLLDGLLPGGAATSLSDMSKPIDLTGKRIALVLSSRTVTELARWGKQRDAFVKSRGYGKTFGSAGYDMNGQRYDNTLTGIIASTDPAGFIPGVIAALQPTLGADAKIVAADDLGVLTSGQADYAIVIDWSFDGGLLSPSQFEKMPFCDTAKNVDLCVPMFKDHWVALVVDPKIRIAALVTSDVGEVKRYSKDVLYDFTMRGVVAQLWGSGDYTNIKMIANQLGGRLPWAKLEPIIRSGLSGPIGKKDYNRAQQLLNEAMQQKQPEAYRMSADATRKIAASGADYSLSITMGYEEAARLGDFESMLQLSYLYSSGAEGVTRDYAAAGKYIAMAYAARKTEHTTYNMGLAKAYGWGGPIDLPEALKLFEAAQALGHPQAAAQAAKVRAQLNPPAPAPADPATQPKQ
ncbi:MAG: sel1 repeat family protein [Sphingomonas sp.]|uniref:tetratricopeptide repeat protein n=1 Tax=Sphingomonas sp. TaxID=28214 RepID=UPI0025EEEE6C|nr:hypothetical protein [Sphingomonas sp.]MBX3565569.1 sel1 repeat family protein [Sphingomonas sp.]